MKVLNLLDSENSSINYEKRSYPDGQQDIVRETWLPLGDHFYEKRIVEALDYMQTEIQKEF